MSAWNLGASKNKCLFPARTIGICFVHSGGETQLFRNVLCFSRLRVLRRPTKKNIYNPSDFVTLLNPVKLCLGDSAPTCLPRQHWLVHSTECSSFTLLRVYSMVWAGLQLIPRLGVHTEHRLYPHASSNREFLLLQALPSFLPQAGKMTLLTQPLCHSTAAVNKSLSVCPCCFSSMALSVCWSFSPIHWDTNPTRCYSIPQVPAGQESIHFKRQKDCLFLRPAFPSLPLPGSLGGVGCETKPFLRLLTCTGELRGEFHTSCKTDSSGLHSSPRSCSLARIIDQTHQWLFSTHVLGYRIASCWGYSWN